jgi:hypothetical protein
MYDPLRSAVNKLRKLIPELKYNVTVVFEHYYDGYNYNNDKIYLKSYIDYKSELHKNNKNNCQISPMKQLIIDTFRKFNLKLYCYYSILHEYGHYYVYHNQRDIFTLDNRERRKFEQEYPDITPESSLKYRELPEEKYCDQFALDFIKEHYDELF